jgi:aquaporin Z
MSFTKKCGAEALGTFALVFAGTGAIIVNDVCGGVVTHVGVALTFGLIVLAMIYAVGDVSGAHLNPAVTIGFFAARRLRGKAVLPYILSQSLGALAASALLRGLFPQHSTLGTTSPAGPAARSVVLEIVLTTFLMFVILSVSTGPKERGTTAGIAVGSVIALEALFAGPICGASMNPARSFAPALVSQHFSGLWIYLIAPIAGALLAVIGCRCARKRLLLGYAARDSFLKSKEDYEKESFVHLCSQQCAQSNGGSLPQSYLSGLFRSTQRPIRGRRAEFARSRSDARSRSRYLRKENAVSV